jgi:hypothetical protein
MELVIKGRACLCLRIHTHYIDECACIPLNSDLVVWLIVDAVIWGPRRSTIMSVCVCVLGNPFAMNFGTNLMHPPTCMYRGSMALEWIMGTFSKFCASGMSLGSLIMVEGGN